MLHRNTVIIGGGPVGLSMALYLARQGKKVTLIDQGLDYSQDGRVLALSFASRKILEQIDSWEAAISTPIKRVQISHTGLGISNIDAASVGLNELGYTVSYANLCHKLMTNAVKNSMIELIVAKVDQVNELANYSSISFTDNANINYQITTEFLIMAEGGGLLQSSEKKINHDYQQKAVVAKIKLKQRQQHVAYERFTAIGPLVLLPFEQDYIIVWALDNILADEVITDPDRLTELLDKHYTHRFGDVRLLGKVSCYLLKLAQVRKRVTRRVVMIGNSAQTVHPVSAQGLNLGLRDVVVLDSLIAKNGDASIHDFSDFDRLRNKDVNNVIGFTHFLATFAHQQFDLLKHARGVGLVALSNLPFIQNKVAKRLIYGS